MKGGGEREDVEWENWETFDESENEWDRDSKGKGRIQIC